MSTSTDGVERFQWDLADRLAKSLKVAGMSVQDMADYLEVHRNTISAWTNGRTDPNGAMLKLWAMRTGAPYQWLRYGRQPGKPEGPDGDGGFPIPPSDPELLLPRVDSNHQPFGVHPYPHPAAA